MISKNILILVFLFIVSIGGFIIWQKSTLVSTTQQTNQSQNTNNGNTQIPNSNRSQIPLLGGRDYKASEITIEETLPKESNFTPYIISYTSDNLKIYAAMNVPDGNGPFPVILLNHGYYNTQTFQTGNGTIGMATILANNGYLTVASDYRGHGKSEGQGGGHQPDYAIDVLN